MWRISISNLKIKGGGAGLGRISVYSNIVIQLYWGILAFHNILNCLFANANDSHSVPESYDSSPYHK